MFKHDFIKFFKSLTPAERIELRNWLMPAGNGTCGPVEGLIKIIGFNPWTDEPFGNHVHGYLNDDPSNATSLYLAYGRLEVLATEEFARRDAIVASVREDIDGALSVMEEGTKHLMRLYSRLFSMKGVARYPSDELARLEETLRSLALSSVT